MPPLRRRSIPFLFLSVFLLSFLAIFFLSRSFPRRNPNPNTSPFSFTVKVLAFDRFESLRRCLRSLAAADYAGDRVALHVHLDHFRDVDPPANASDLVDRKLADAGRILEFVDGFKWGHGEKRVHYRTRNVGLQAQWLEAWWPSSDDDFAFVVEDDLEVSDLYYRYLKGLILKYYYDRENYSPSIYGASLQRPRFVPGKHGNKLHLDAETHVFLYQLVGTWGQLLFPRPWKEFRLWYDIHKSKGIKPFLEGMVTTGWYKRMGEKIWTPWFIKFIHSRGYYNIYTNFQHERALSVSHRDAGVNYGKTAGPDSTLLDERSLDFNIWELQPLRKLRWYDFCFREVLPRSVARRSNELGFLLDSMQKSKNIVFISLFGTAERVVRNLLCHLERLKIRNYILVGPESEYLLDLARRGHPVVHADDLSVDVAAHEFADIQFIDSATLQEVLVRAYTIKKGLERGHDAWMVSGNLLPLSDSLFQQAGESYDFFAARDAELLHARSSLFSNKIWSNEFIHKLASAARSSANAGSNLDNQMLFANLVGDALGDLSGAKVVRGAAPDFGAELNGFQHEDSNTKKYVFWKSDSGLVPVEDQLRNAGFWIIDGDSSCIAVVC